MKKFISLVLAVALLTAALTLTSCGGKDDEYYAYGLHYTLPEEYEKITVPYSENCYYDGSAYFYFNIYSEGDMEANLGINPNISIESYTIKFLGWNNLSYDIYTYDEEKDRSIVKYVHKYSAEEGIEDELYIHVFFRGSYRHLYTVTMSCPASERDVYEATFDKWANEIYAD